MKPIKQINSQQPEVIACQGGREMFKTCSCIEQELIISGTIITKSPCWHYDKMKLRTIPQDSMFKGVYLVKLYIKRNKLAPSKDDEKWDTSVCLQE